MQILIADDSPAIRKALRRLLEAGHPWQITEVEDGQAAISKALQLRPDLVILDLAMPVSDGLTAAREISQALPEIPIVMYTMHRTQSLELAAQKLGVRKMLSKVQSQALVSTVEELLGESQSSLMPGNPNPLPLPESVRTPAGPPPAPEITVSSENSISPDAADSKQGKTPEI